ncbi:MAG: UDP-N-acetylmuramate dehydrogenase [Bacteroidia bacterium]|nr:UDP-N-acetylmuramate dehydrogenase [Bacteroidia bacterium]
MNMRICRNTSLKPFNTFGLDYRAGTMIHLRTEKEVKAIFKEELSCKKPLLVLGGGSNILFTGDFKGTILLPEFGGMRIEEQKDEHVIVSAGAGIKWDRFAEWCVDMGFSGIENLSGIPGNVGAVPVQNIGAYGTEAKDSIIKIRTISTYNGRVRIFNNDECNFGYRTSIFKSTEKGKYLVTRVYFRLELNFNPNLNYGSLKEEAGKLGRSTLKNVRSAVLNIMHRKLPDPEVIGNGGSFFKNPVVSNTTAEKLIKAYPGIPVYDDLSVWKKLAAGWLVEQCGWKGKRAGDAGVHEKQALVLVNHGNASGKDILNLSEKIRKSVREKFGVNLENEVEIVD